MPSSGTQVAELKYGYWVYGLDFSSAGNRWATGSFDGKAIVADASSGKVLAEFKHDLMVLDLALAPDGPWLAVITTGSHGPGRVTVWDVNTHEQRVLAEFNGVGYGNVVFSPDTRWLAAPLGSSGEIAVWQTQIWPEITRLTTPPGSPTRLIVSPNGQRLAVLLQSGQPPSRILVWDTATWQVVSQFALADVGWDIAFSPDGRWLAAGLGQGAEQPALYEGQLWDAVQRPTGRAHAALATGVGGGVQRRRQAHRERAVTMQSRSGTCLWVSDGTARTRDPEENHGGTESTEYPRNRCFVP